MQWGETQIILITIQLLEMPFSNTDEFRQERGKNNHSFGGWRKNQLKIKMESDYH